MTDYTPTTDQVKYRYQLDVGNSPISGRSFDEAGLEFDRWLAAHDAEVLREAATALGETIRGLNRSNPLELAYINCTHIDAQELRHRANRIERGER